MVEIVPSVGVKAPRRTNGTLRCSHVHPHWSVHFSQVVCWLVHLLTFLFSRVSLEEGGEEGFTGPRGCKLERIGAEQGSDGGAAVVMETPRGAGVERREVGPVCFVIEGHVARWSSSPLPPLPPIQPSRAAAPVSYYKMAAEAPPPTRTSWTLHGRIY